MTLAADFVDRRRRAGGWNGRGRVSVVTWPLNVGKLVNEALSINFVEYTARVVIPKTETRTKHYFNTVAS